MANPGSHKTDGEQSLCWYRLAIVKAAAVNIGVQMSFQDPAFSSFG